MTPALDTDHAQHSHLPPLAGTGVQARGWGPRTADRDGTQATKSPSPSAQPLTSRPLTPALADSLSRVECLLYVWEVLYSTFYFKGRRAEG